MRTPSTSKILVAAALAGLCSLPLAAQARDGRNAAALGGLAVGAVGGVLLQQAIQGQQTAAPAPAPVEVEPDPVPVRRPLPVMDSDPGYRKAQRLHRECDDGSRESCIRFGIIIGQNRERQAQWRRANPDMFAWEND